MALRDLQLRQVRCLLFPGTSSVASCRWLQLAIAFGSLHLPRLKKEKLRYVTRSQSVSQSMTQKCTLFLLSLRQRVDQRRESSNIRTPKFYSVFLSFLPLQLCAVLLLLCASLLLYDAQATLLIGKIITAAWSGDGRTCKSYNLCARSFDKGSFPITDICSINLRVFSLFRRPGGDLPGYGQRDRFVQSPRSSQWLRRPRDTGRDVQGK